MTKSYLDHDVGCVPRTEYYCGLPALCRVHERYPDIVEDELGDATDDLWFYTETRGRINFTDIIASPILRKPSGNHHNGLQRPGFNTSVAPGQPTRASYDLFLNWILNGAPQ